MKSLYLIFAILFSGIASAQTLHLGQPVDNASSTSSILGASTVTVTSTTCDTLTNSGCTVSANGPYVKTLTFVGSPGGAVTVTSAISPGHEICVANSISYTVTVGGGSGTTVSVPAGTGIDGTAAICMVSPDGTNYVQVGSSGGVGSVGAVGTLQTAAASSAFASTGVQGSEYLQSVNKPNATFLQALHYAAVTPVKIKIIADSQWRICQQMGGSGPPCAYRKAELLRQSLQSQYGSYGTGIMPLYWGSTTLDNQAWTVTGTWAQDCNLGPNQTGSCSLVSLSSGAVATFSDVRNLAWNHFNVYCATSSASKGMAVSIDGGSSITICGTTTESYTAHVVNIASTSSTTHSVTVTCATGPCLLYAGEGTNGTSGVAIDNTAISGAESTSFGADPAVQLAFSDIDPAGTQLAIVALMTNDCYYGNTVANLASNISAIIAHEQALSSSRPPSVMLEVPAADIYVGSTTSTGECGVLGAQMTAALQALHLATTPAISYVNFQDQWGSVFAGTTSSDLTGLWSTTGTGNPTPGDAYPGVHESQMGNESEFGMIYTTLIDAPAPTAFQSGGGSGTVTGTGTIDYAACWSATTAIGNCPLYLNAGTTENITIIDDDFSGTNTSAGTVPMYGTYTSPGTNANYIDLKGSTWYINSNTLVNTGLASVDFSDAFLLRPASDNITNGSVMITGTPTSDTAQGDPLMRVVDGVGYAGQFAEGTAGEGSCYFSIARLGPGSDVQDVLVSGSGMGCSLVPYDITLTANGTNPTNLTLCVALHSDSTHACIAGSSLTASDSTSALQGPGQTGLTSNVGTSGDAWTFTRLTIHATGAVGDQQWFMTDPLSMTGTECFPGVLFCSTGYSMDNAGNVTENSVTATGAPSAFAAGSTVGGSAICTTSTGCGSGLGGTLSSGSVSISGDWGTGATATVTGLDGNHQVSVTAGTASLGTSASFTVTFTASRGHTSYCTISPASPSTQAATLPNFSANSATAYTVRVSDGSTLISGDTYLWNVSCP